MGSCNVIKVFFFKSLWLPEVIHSKLRMSTNTKLTRKEYAAYLHAERPKDSCSS